MLTALTCGAADIWVAQQGTGNSSGSDTNNLMPRIAAIDESNWVAGTTFRLCNTFTNNFTIAGDGSAGNPITIHGEPGSIFSYDWPNGTTVILGNQGPFHHDLLIENLTITTPSKLVTNVNAIAFFVGGNVEIRNNTIYDLYLRHSNQLDCEVAFPVGISATGSPTNVLIHNNNITNVGNGIVAGANGANAYETNLQIYSNSCVHVSWGIGQYCNGTNSQSWNRKIWANYLNPDTNWDGCPDNLHNDGIAGGVPSNAFMVGTNHNMKIFRNFIGPDVGAQTTAAIFLESGQRTFFNESPNIFDNVIYQAPGARSWGSGAFSMNANNGLIANNSFIFKNGDGTMMIINASGASGAYGLATNGVTPWTVYNEYGEGVTGVIGIGGGFDIATTEPLSVTNTDYKVISSVDGNAQWWNSAYWVGRPFAGEGYRDPADFPQFVRFDNHSAQLTNISCVDAAFYPLSTDTNLVSKGTNLTAIALARNCPELTNDFYGNPRPAVGAWTIGAVEGSSTNVTANFTGTPTSGTAPLDVAFTDASVNATNWLYNFGDGHTTTTRNPTHTFTSAGSYTVSLTIIGLGQTDTKTRTSYITVTAPASSALTNAVFSGDLNIQGPLKIR